MEIKAIENRAFISLVNRELKRLHDYLYYNLPYKNQSGNEASKEWAMKQIESLHKTLMPYFFIEGGKDNG